MKRMAQQAADSPDASPPGLRAPGKKGGKGGDDGEHDDEPIVQTGDIIKIRPCMCDEWGNPVAARMGSLMMVLKHPTGQEAPTPVIAQQIRGVWTHDVQYEVRTKGRYKVDILLDDVAIPGCPIEFYVRHRAPG